MRVLRIGIYRVILEVELRERESVSFVQVLSLLLPPLENGSVLADCSIEVVIGIASILDSICAGVFMQFFSGLLCLFSGSNAK